MTPQERAEKVKESIPEGLNTYSMELLILQIAEAEREAVENAVMTMSNNAGVFIAFNEGFAAARKRAKGIVKKSLIYHKGNEQETSWIEATMNPLDLVDAISKMEPDKGSEAIAQQEGLSNPNRSSGEADK